MLRAIFLLALGVFGAFWVLVIYLYWNQRSLLYFPSHVDQKGLGSRTFKPWLGKTGGFLGYVREVPRPERVVLFFHGNGGEALDRDWVAGLFSASTVIALVEYPGYGARAGTSTESSLLDAAKEAYDEAHDRWKVGITAVGESLGSGVASYLASQRPLFRLGLISPFSSAVDVARWHYPYLPVGLLMKDRFDSIEYLNGTQVPLHVIHGTLDTLVPLKLGKKLFDEYKGPQKFLTEVPGFGHNDLYSALLGSPLAEGFVRFVQE